MEVLRVDHVGINVEDLAAAKAFFVELGFIITGESEMQGDMVDRVTGLKGVKDDLVMLQASDGHFNLELVKFHHPVDKAGIQPSAANSLGLRHLCFEVDDVEGMVANLKSKGYDLVGKLQNFENVWKLCYVRGPEGIIVELAEKLG